MAKILAVCSSVEKGTRKDPMPEGRFERGFGLVRDAHGGDGHRQVSLLAMESIDRMRSAGFDVGPGDFAENLTTTGLDLVGLPVGTRLQVGPQVILEISQIGKECHAGCAIFRQVGRCVMPKEGVFARVAGGGVVRAGDELRVA